MEKCDKCGTTLNFTKTPQMVHYGKLDCPRCEKFKKWVSSPDKVGVRTTTSRYDIKDVLKFHNKKECLCFFCLRKRDELGLNETFTIDHIDELNDGGEDEIGNLQILCFACHKLKNWVRLYVNKHLKHFFNRPKNTPVTK